MSITDGAAIGHRNHNLHLQAKLICQVARLEVIGTVEISITAPHDSYPPPQPAGASKSNPDEGIDVTP